MAYGAPVLRDAENDWEPYALEMLARVLDGNDAARLNRELVRRSHRPPPQVRVTTASIAAPACFILSATPASGKTAGEAEQALRGEVRSSSRKVSATTSSSA